MQVHILAGDSLAGDLRETEIDGDFIVCRECMIEGPVRDIPLETFFEARSKYLSGVYDKKENYYFENVMPEFEKILNVPAGADIYLWFEYELFCQVNMWFVLDLLKTKSNRIFRVLPSVRNENDKWRGFGSLTTGELERCFTDSVEFSAEDIDLGSNLWMSYQAQDLEALRILSGTDSNCFPYLREVCEAEIERKLTQRPQRTLQKIVSTGVTEFGQVFQQFAAEEGIYGFGDLQVKSMYEKL